MRIPVLLVFRVVITASLCGCASTPQPSARPATASPEPAEYSVTKSSSSQPNRGACTAANGCNEPAVAVAPGRCDVEECDGELPPTAIAELRAAANDTRECYERELKDNRQLEGKMTIRIRLAKGREPCEVTVGKNDVGGSDAFVTCILNRLRSIRAQSDNGCVDLVLPLSFVRQEVEGPAAAGATGR